MPLRAMLKARRRYGFLVMAMSSAHFLTNLKPRLQYINNTAAPLAIFFIVGYRQLLLLHRFDIILRIRFSSHIMKSYATMLALRSLVTMT